MKRNIKVTDLDTGEVLNNVDFIGGYNITYSRFDDDGRLKHIRNLDNGKYDSRNWIKNDIYRPVAFKLVTKFEELKHIRPEKILFLEDMDWTPGANSWIARISKANKQMKQMVGYEYVLETRNYYTKNMSKEQIVALVFHELRHIDGDGNLKQHDVEDWGDMIATLGVDWATTKGDIINILDDDFEEWDRLRKAGNQISMFENVVPMKTAK